MSSSISSLSVKTLVQVLKKLSPNQEIGFDPYRDERTKTKEKLLQHIVQNNLDSAIIAAIEAVKASEASDAAQAIADQEAMAATAQVTPIASEADQLAAILKNMASKAGIDESAVKRIVQIQFEDENKSIRAHYDRLTDQLQSKIDKLQAPTIVEVKNTATGEVKSLGVQHKNFPDLLLACQAREASGHHLSIWLHGPAGTGKTHAAHEIAKALNLPYQSNGTLLTEHALSGFIDAGGKYHRTAFREIFENGGVYLGDEYDVWCPKAAMWLQAALANGYTRFPDGMIKRHVDCIIIFGANTVGKGATSEYSTRNKVDDANGNRVVFQEWPLDEMLEMQISPNPEWTRTVQKFRKRVADRKLKGHMITPRQSIQGAALLAAGMEWAKVETMVLRRGLSNEQWASVQ